MRKLVVLIFLFILLNIQAEQYQIVSIYPHGSKFYVNNKLVDLSKGKPRIDGTARLRFDKNQTVKFRCYKNNKVNIFSITSKENSKYSVDSYLFRYDQAKKKKGTDSVYLEKSIFKNNFKDNKGNIQKRLALIIGNNLYERDTSSCRDLPNTNVDAFDVANKLDTLGFDTYTYFNLSKEDMEFAFRRFVKLAKQENYDVALFYYSGHGIQNDGKNYLVPVDAFYEDVKELAQSCYSFDEIFRSMASTGCKTKLVFLDACRNQPPWADKDDGDQGVSKENANGSYVVFASEPYEYAYAADDNERNSPFTKAFLDNVSKPFPNVRDAVDVMSKSMKNISKPYIFGVGDIDFSFLKQKYSKEQCENAALKAKELISDGKLYDAMNLCVDYLPKDSLDKTIPYDSEIELILRNSYRSLFSDKIFSNKSVFLEIDYSDVSNYGCNESIMTNNGNFLFLLKSDMIVYKYDTSTGKELGKFGIDVMKDILENYGNTHIQGVITDMIYNKNKNKITTYSTFNGEIQHWDIATLNRIGTPLSVFPAGSIWQSYFSASGNMCLFYQTNMLCLYDIEKNEIVSNLKLEDENLKISRLSINEDGSLIAVTLSDRTAHVINVADGKEIDLGENFGTDCKFDENGKILFIKLEKFEEVDEDKYESDNNSDNETIIDGIRIIDFKNNIDYITNDIKEIEKSWANNDGTIFFIESDNDIIMWDVYKREYIKKIDILNSTIFDIFISEDSHSFKTLNDGNFLNNYITDNYSPINSIVIPLDNHVIDFTDDGKYFWCSRFEEWDKIKYSKYAFDNPFSPIIETSTWNSDINNCVFYNKDKSLKAEISFNNKYNPSLVIYDVLNQNIVSNIKDLISNIKYISFSPDSKYIIISFSNTSYKIYNTFNGQLVCDLNAHHEIPLAIFDNDYNIHYVDDGNNNHNTIKTEKFMDIYELRNKIINILEEKKIRI